MAMGSAVLKTNTPVKLNVYSLDGRLVGSLAGDRRTDGFLVYPWDGADASGQRVPPGIYVVKIKVDAQAGVQGLSQIINVAY